MIAVDEQAAANECIVAVEDARYGTLETVGSPVRVNGVQGQVRGPGPELGQDTNATLQAIEYPPGDHRAAHARRDRRLAAKGQ